MIISLTFTAESAGEKKISKKGCCDIILSFLIDYAGRCLYRELCLPEILCIIRCLESDSAVM